MSYLYVMEHGSKIHLDGGYFTVTYKDESVKLIPKKTLEAISLFGSVQMTTQCMEECLKRGIPVNYFSKTGAYFGRLESTRHMNIFRQKKQFALTETPEFALELSQRMIEAKIHNQYVVLRRYIKNETEEFAEIEKNMRNAMKNSLRSQSINELMGYEGFASRNYFKGLSKIIRPDFAFDGRSRRPPKDPFNSMLSLGYTILMYEVYGQIENRGLSPFAGFLHQDRERHPTLASDLMEEWRAVIVDSVVLSLIQGNEISINEFWKEEDQEGIFLTNTALKILITKLEKKMRTETSYLKDVVERTSFRKAIWMQSGKLVQAIEKEDPQIYEPIRIR